jgi:long-chain acyl-CoA synthetase
VDDQQLIADASHIVEAMGIRPDDTQIAIIPLSHAYGLSVLLLPALLQGTALVLRESFVPHQLPTDAVTHRARIFPGVPYMFEYFIAHPPPGGWPAGLERLISAGARLDPATIRRFHELFGVKIHTFYGATETGGIAFDNGDDPFDNDTVGHPLSGVTISLKHDDDAPPGAGRVHVQSSAVATGYLTQGGDSLSGGGFLTGDFGTFDACGRLKLLGRASSFVNVAGRKVEPDEVERVLRSMPGVCDVRVVGAPDPQRGQQVVACVVTSNGGDRLTAIDVRRFCSGRLAPHKIPRTVIFLESIPITARGKTDRNALARVVDAHLHETS